MLSASWSALRSRYCCMASSHVPRPMATAAASATHTGTSNSLRYPELNRATVMMAIVFCASLAPWLKATKPLESICSLRKAPLARLGRTLRKRLRSSMVTMYASTSPATSGWQRTPGRPRPTVSRPPVNHQPHADKSPDQSVRRARRQPGAPGDGAEQDGNEHRQGDASLGCHQATHRVRHLRVKLLRRHDRAHEVETRGEGDGDAGASPASLPPSRWRSPYRGSRW